MGHRAPRRRTLAGRALFRAHNGDPDLSRPHQDLPPGPPEPLGRGDGSGDRQMAADRLTPEARLENLRALMSAAGLGAEEASERLAGAVLITHEDADEAAACLVRE